MSATDIQRYRTFPRAKLIQLIQSATRGTSAHRTVTELSKMAVDELAALLVKLEGRLGLRMARGVRYRAPRAVRRAIAHYSPLQGACAMCRTCLLLQKRGK
jgi:hypothetical protein